MRGQSYSWINFQFSATLWEPFPSVVACILQVLNHVPCFFPPNSKPVQFIVLQVAWLTFQICTLTPGNKDLGPGTQGIKEHSAHSIHSQKFGGRLGDNSRAAVKGRGRGNHHVTCPDLLASRAGFSTTGGHSSRSAPALGWHRGSWPQPPLITWPVCRSVAQTGWPDCPNPATLDYMTSVRLTCLNLLFRLPAESQVGL